MQIYIIIISYCLVVWSIVTSLYSNLTIRLMLAMYRYHRGAFYEHIKSLLAQYICAMLSFTTIIGNSIYSFYSVVCATGLFNKEFRTPYYDILRPHEGICAAFLTFNSKEGLHFLNYMFMVLDFTVLLPVVLFLLLDRPHDCFVCLGKDPDRVYSTY